MKKVYMVAGKARHGKDTVSNYIKDIYEEKGKKAIILQISFPLKFYASKVLDWDYSEETKPRDFLQHIGIDVIRNKMGEDFLVNRLIQDMEVLFNYCDIIIVSDVRLPIEFNMVKGHFRSVVNIFIDRPNFENNLSDIEKSHITETALNDFNDYNYIIKNDGDLTDLKNKVKLLLKEELE